MDSRISALSQWLNRKDILPNRFYNKSYVDKIDTEEWSAFLSIDSCYPLHKANYKGQISLKESINSTFKYLDNCSSIIGGLEGGWLDRDEQHYIESELGKPPLPCSPIYLVTVGSNQSERVVYVGKSKSSSRFDGGHSVALKLHHPKYNKLKKRIYRCTVWFNFNNEYVVIDWLRPEAVALEILDIIETQLIYDLQPELNISKHY